MPLTYKRCVGCEEHKPTTDFNTRHDAVDGLRGECKKCSSEKVKKWAMSNPYRTLFNAKKSHALRAGVEFDLELADIQWNEYCPVLGVKLSYDRRTTSKSGVKQNSPSFDRIDPTKGYIKGNVIIVSARANMIKNNATPEELQRVAAFYTQLIPQVGEHHAV